MCSLSFRLITHSECLQELDLDDNLIGDLGGREILEALMDRKEGQENMSRQSSEMIPTARACVCHFLCLSLLLCICHLALLSVFNLNYDPLVWR